MPADKFKVENVTFLWIHWGWLGSRCCDGGFGSRTWWGKTYFQNIYRKLQENTSHLGWWRLSRSQADELGCATFPYCFKNDFTLRWCHGVSIIAAPLGCWKNFRLALSLSSIKQRLRGADRFQHCLYSHRNDKFNARATLRLTFKTRTKDRKLYEDWGARPNNLMTRGQRGLILSLLFDHCLLLHPEQTARIENKLPAYTAGSLQRKLQIDVLLEFIKSLLAHQNPADKLKELAGLVDDVFQFKPSGKHMIGRDRTDSFATVPCCWLISQESKYKKFKNLNIE